MSQQKFSRTGAYEKWGRLRRLAWVAPAVIFAVSVLTHAPAALDFAGPAENPGLAIATFILVDAVWAIFSGLVISAAWIALCHYMRKRARSEATFDATHDIDYYREKLEGATPALVSMLADLRVEPRKDMAAALLRLKLHKVIDFNADGDPYIIGQPAGDLCESDRFLLDRIAQGGISANDSLPWAKLAQREALATPYLKTNEHASSARQIIMGQAAITSFLMPAATFIIGNALAIIVLISPLGQKFNDFMAQGSPTTEGFASLVQNDPVALVGFLLFSLSFFVGTYGTVYPLVKAISAAASVASRTHDVYRTPEGDSLAECIFGLRNWIRDFTTMSQADRDAVAVWDDFFVYAVALDQGSEAVNQLLPAKFLSGSNLSQTASDFATDAGTIAEAAFKTILTQRRGF